jgi:hypothetical protein
MITKVNNIKFNSKSLNIAFDLQYTIVDNGRESPINRALDGSTYPCLLFFVKKYSCSVTEQPILGIGNPV